MKRLVSLLALASLMLVGCVTIPDTGPITAAEPTQVPERNAVEFIPKPPAQDATPEAVILGFLFAGVSPDDDYGVARQYLTDAAASTWDPAAAVHVRTGQPQVSLTGETTGEVALTLSSRVDGRGVMHQDAGTTTLLSFDMTRVEGQWRLSSVPDGIVVSSYHFEQLFRSIAVKWFTPDGEHLVPDLRWFLDDTATLTARVVHALLDGPATWLQSSVISAAAPGSEVVGSIADRPGGGISVTLSSSRPAAVTSQELARFAMQVQRSLAGTGTGAVEVLVDGVEGVRGLSSEAEVPVSESLWPRPLLFAGGELRVAETGGAVITGMGELLTELGARSYALRPGDSTSRNGAVEAGGDIFTIVDGGAEQIASGTATDPSVDRYGTVWWVDDAAEQAVHRWFEGTSEVLPVDLADERVTAVQVSPEGSRLALVTSAQGMTTVRLFGIVRAADAAISLVLGPEIVPTGGRTVDIVWNSLDSLALVTVDEGVAQVRLLGLDGTTTALISPSSSADVTGITPTAGGGALIALTEDGRIHSVAPGRVVAFTGVTDGVFLGG